MHQPGGRVPPTPSRRRQRALYAGHANRAQGRETGEFCTLAGMKITKDLLDLLAYGLGSLQEIKEELAHRFNGNIFILNEHIMISVG